MKLRRLLIPLNAFWQGVKNTLMTLQCGSSVIKILGF